jgi:hypothetical protein
MATANGFTERELHDRARHPQAVELPDISKIDIRAPRRAYSFDEKLRAGTAPR